MQDDIKESLKDIKDDLVFLKVETAKNTLSLETHMRRTTASEARITYLERVFIGLLVTVVGAILIKWLIA